MIKTVFKSISLISISLCMIVSIAASTGAANKADASDAILLKNGDTLTGTVLNNTFTVITPYTNIALEKDKISKIELDFEHENHDVITLTTGGLMEGTIEESAISFKSASGKMMSLEKKQCKNIYLNQKR